MANFPDGLELSASIPDVDSADLVQMGGQKAVYRAVIQDEVVAVKVIAVESDAQIFDEIEVDVSEEEIEPEDAAPSVNSTIERAKREVAILEQVDVPVLARRGPLGLAAFQFGGRNWLYFTEEWIEGQSLLAMIRQGRLTVEQVVRLGVDLVHAINWLSSRAMVHRDIKPANVMWAEDRARFVLIDPGIALDLQGPSLTQFPMAVGTFAYQSPEQMDYARKRDLDFRSDLFALGIVLYEAAAGEHPFMKAGTTALQVMSGILTDSPKPVNEIVEDFPTTVGDFIIRLLQKPPHFRYRTCTLVRRAIEDIATDLGIET